MAARAKIISKADLMTALSAAKEAGFEQVSVTIESPSGHRMQMTAGNATAAQQSAATPLEIWKAGRAT